jgi:hypothetical protein
MVRALDAYGESDDPGVLAGSGGVVQAGQQVGALGPGPSQGVFTVGQSGHRSWPGADGQGWTGAGVTGDAGVGEGGCVLVVVQQPGDGLVPVTIRVKAAGQGVRVLADQVVHPETASGSAQ